MWRKRQGRPGINPTTPHSLQGCKTTSKYIDNNLEFQFSLQAHFLEEAFQERLSTNVCAKCYKTSGHYSVHCPLFSVHQCPGFKSQEPTNEVNSEWWARLSMVYSQDVQAFTRNFKERRKEEKRENKRRGRKLRVMKRRDKKRREKEMFCVHYITVQCRFILIDAVSSIKSLISD